MEKERTPYLIPPHYDIDALLDVDRTQRLVADEIVDSIYDAIETVPKSDEHDYFRPDSSLLPPEVTVRDINNFDMSMGSGLLTNSAISAGYPVFIERCGD